MALFQQELRNVARNCCQATNGQVAVTFSDENLLRFKIKINPNHGLYEGGPLYEFTIRASDNYPISPPIVIACSYILHPNINEYGEVYLQCLADWSSDRSCDLMSLVKSLLELFHRPNFHVITNEEVRDLTDVEFIRSVSVWKHSQNSERGYHGDGVNYTRDTSLGLGSRISLLAESGHRENNCECRNEYIVVTNSRPPPPPHRLQRPGSAQMRRAIHQEDHLQTSVSMIDLSDVWDSLRNVEPDYEIRSVSSSEDETVLEREVTASSTRRSLRRGISRLDTWLSGGSSSTRQSDYRQADYRQADSRQSDYRQAEYRQADSRLTHDSRFADSRLSNYYRSNDTWLSRQGTMRQNSAASSRRVGALENNISRNETPFLARNRNRDDSKPEFRKDLNNFL